LPQLPTQYRKLLARLEIQAQNKVFLPIFYPIQYKLYPIQYQRLLKIQHKRLTIIGIAAGATALS
jgi:hypothetical protein